MLNTIGEWLKPSVSDMQITNDSEEGPNAHFSKTYNQGEKWILDINILSNIIQT